MIQVLAKVLSFLPVAIGLALPASAGDPLPSWNDGAARKAIVAFVERVTTSGSFTGR